MTHEIEAGGQTFSFVRLEPEDLAQALLLCDQCVGKNLYTREELMQAIENENSTFQILKTEEGQIAGYVYYYLTDTEQIARTARLKETKISEVCMHGSEMPVGKIQSVGIREEFRGRGLAGQLVRFALDRLGRMGASEAFIICWNIKGQVPLGKVLKECSFTHLTTAKMIWYDKKELYCPYCKGRCKCDAEIYYKRISINCDK